MSCSLSIGQSPTILHHQIPEYSVSPAFCFSVQADKVDGYLHGLLIKMEPSRQHLACFGTWVLYHTLQAMINYTLSGFELELYATHEYHYIYW